VHPRATSLVLFSGVLSLLLIMGLISNSFAVQMTVLMLPSDNSADAVMTGVRFITFKYDPASQIAKVFNGKIEKVSFILNGTEGGMDQVISAFNQAITTQKQSPVRITNANLTYTADIRGEPDRVSLSYKIDLKPNLSNIVLEKSGSQGTVIDLDWRGVVINQPLVVDAPKYGKLPVNYPIGLLQVTHPQIAQQLLNSPAASVMRDPLLDFADIGRPMDTWHFLFDPTGSQAGAVGSGFREAGGARAVSIYSLGESSFREGTLTEEVKDTSATVTGTKVDIHASTPPPSGQIQILGFSRVAKSSGGELAFVSQQAPEGTVTATGGFPLQVLLVLGGMMGAVAIFVLIKARK
jgi:hypothetical protein